MIADQISFDPNFHRAGNETRPDIRGVLKRYESLLADGSTGISSNRRRHGGIIKTFAGAVEVYDGNYHRPSRRLRESEVGQDDQRARPDDQTQLSQGPAVFTFSPRRRAPLIRV